MSTKLDANQVIKQAFDESTGRLRTDAVLNASGAEIELDAADGDNIAISDGTNTLVVNPDGSINTSLSGSISIEIDSADGDNVAISDGTHTLDVNTDGSINVKIVQGIVQQILKADDMIASLTWADFGLSTQRITSIVYTATSVGAYTATKSFSYTNVGGQYRLDSFTWAVV